MFHMHVNWHWMELTQNIRNIHYWNTIDSNYCSEQVWVCVLLLKKPAHSSTDQVWERELHQRSSKSSRGVLLEVELQACSGK